MESLAEMWARALAEVAASRDGTHLDEIRVRWLGKKGLLTEQLKSLGKLPAAGRPAAGAQINEAKAAVEAAVAERRAVLEAAAVENRLAAERVDVTLPGRGE
ncbi:MAG TPA: phenylalanine--tRNA ligase subunit alpha, partial [Steroidobacteraceae bacterium]|nr:phenylalanine--tRNA ligase subunit alpha [Steroidobacteraceae bacterium]